MPTVPLADRLPRVDSVPVSRLILATPLPIATSAVISLMAMPERASTRRAPDVLTVPPMTGDVAGPRTCTLTLAVPVSDRPCAASFRLRKPNGTSPVKSSTSAGVPAVVTVPPPLRPRPAPSLTLALKVSLLPAKVPDDETLMPPKPAPRVCDVCTPAASILKATAGLAGAPVTLTVPEIEPAASRPGEKLLASETGTSRQRRVEVERLPDLAGHRRRAAAEVEHQPVERRRAVGDADGRGLGDGRLDALNGRLAGSEFDGRRAVGDLDAARGLAPECP